MKEFKGTKGLWKVEPFMHKTPERHQEITVRVDSENFKQVAIASVYDMNTETGKKNAKLIAAAPEILSSLTRLWDDIKNNSGMSKNDLEHYNKSFNIEESINKALK